MEELKKKRGGGGGKGIRECREESGNCKGTFTGRDEEIERRRRREKDS